jgi:hypothetical protein
MCSNRTSILCIDRDLIPLLGFSANNKKLLPMQPQIAEDLSKSNVVTINGDSVMYPHRPNTGITLPHKR